MTLTPEQQAARGLELAELLHLKQARDPRTGQHYTPARYDTSYGTKSAMGLYATVRRVLDAPSDTN
jgi:hypothetical protein